MNKELEEAAESFIKDEEKPKTETAETSVHPKKSLGNVKDLLGSGAVGADEFKEKTHMDTGFQKLFIENLPSGGMFYPEGIKLLIKAATAGEIKHWSTMDETDPTSINDNINAILEKLTNVQIPNKKGYYKDLLDVDRLYIIFALNEFTFKEGENKIVAEVPLDNGEVEKVHVTKDSIKLFDMPEKLQKFYNPLSRSFVFNVDGEDIELTMPSIGVSNFVESYKNRAMQEGRKFDQDFAMYALFLFKDWRTLNDSVYKNAEAESSRWSVKKISLLSSFVDTIKTAINPQMTVQTSAGEVTQQLNFQGGFKSLFIIPSLLD